MIKSILAAAFLALAVPALAAEPTRGVTDAEIIVGTYTDLSGVTAMWGVNNSNSWRMVFDRVNAEGGINGRKINYIIEDNQYQVPRSVQAANKLINRDGVLALIAALAGAIGVVVLSGLIMAGGNALIHLVQRHLVA